MKTSFWAIMAAIGFVSLGLVGCASHRTYDTSEQLQVQVEENRLAITDLQESDEKQDKKLKMLIDTVQEAIARAKKAGVIAEGMFMYEVTLNDDSVHFGFGKSDMSKKAKKALDKFALKLKVENEDVFVEVQGHTDNVGSEIYNLFLGKSRADAVMGYLHLQHGIPLHRMSTFSYGESKPVVDNGNPTNRAKNRRVALVVVK